ncbi:MAG: anthranilate synthase component I family protein [Spirochaetaceae bacterium]|jgi:anthranilate synthase component 1|nr:anthranilate synthase component I family protein [Spirochaetaceae bacterium]
MKEVTGLNYQELSALAKNYNSVPVTKTLPIAARDPVETFKALKNLSKQCFILESLEDAGRWGRYTFLGYDPKLEISCVDGVLSIKNGATIQIETFDPAAYIAGILSENRGPALPDMPPFMGGLAGYFSFDYIKYGEPVLRRKMADGGFDAPAFKDFDLMLFDKVIAYDRLKGEIIIIITIKTDSFDENYERAKGELEHLARIVAEGAQAAIPPLRICSPFRPLFSEARYCEMIRRAIHYIHEGDIFQVVLSNQYEAEVEGSLFDTYRILRELNPSPYMFYFSSDDVEIAGASPETLVKLRDGEVFTFPLAGTRPRGKTPEEDIALERELLADEKELAEHTMLVDLGRNDLGRICEFGSVTVEKYRAVERFSHVMHIGSTVKGRIRAGKSALDAINAVLPAGTLSGAPKIRACQIIRELEEGGAGISAARGLYGGAVGYLDLSGGMDACIAIRLAYKRCGKVFARSGAGIVADSVPEKEYAECRNKLAAVMRALEQAAGGINDSADR